jgi:hypothetical protein
VQLKPVALLLSRMPCLAGMNLRIAFVALPVLRGIGNPPAVPSLDAVERHGSGRRDLHVFTVVRRSP